VELQRNAEDWRSGGMNSEKPWYRMLDEKGDGRTEKKKNMGRKGGGANKEE